MATFEESSLICSALLGHGYNSNISEQHLMVEIIVVVLTCIINVLGDFVNDFYQHV